QSVLNYNYIRNLTLPNGQLTVDLSRGVLNADLIHDDENESFLHETQGLGSGNMPYRLRWFAPIANIKARFGLNIKEATHYCGGAPVNGPSGVARVDGLVVLRSPVDWDYNGKIDNPSHPAVDINFNGPPPNDTAY